MERTSNQKNNLDIHINGLPALSSFAINSKYSQEYKTLITQEMLKKGFLASNICYLSTEHDEQTIKKYLSILDDIFQKYLNVKMVEILMKY